MEISDSNAHAFNCLPSASGIIEYFAIFAIPILYYAHRLNYNHD